MRGRNRGIGSYTLGDRYVTPERRLSQMLTQQGSRGGPSHSWQETMGRLAQQLAGAYIGYKDKTNQDAAYKKLTELEPDSYSMQPTMDDQQIMESAKVQDILRQKTDADRMSNPMIQRSMSGIGYEQDMINQAEDRIKSFDKSNYLNPSHMDRDIQFENDDIARAKQNIERHTDEFNRTMGRLNANEPTDDQRADAVQRELLGQRKASEVRTLKDKMPHLEYAMQNLRGMENNPYAQRLLQGLMMNKLDRDETARLAGIDRAQKLEDVKLGRDFTKSERIAGEDFKRGETDRTLTSKEKVAGNKGGFANAEKLRKEFIKGAGDFVKVRDAYGRIKASAQNPSPAGDLALIFNYMKVLDPGSTVREGEFATAQNSASIPERLRAKYNQVINGERLADTQRVDFVSRAGDLYAQQENFYKGHEDRYRDLSRSYDLNPDDVVYGLNQGFMSENPPSQISEAEQTELNELRAWKARQSNQ